ncbi:MGMT family protein [Candidatus Falkowbacteria bacterium]|nr:MGMT family protein [Candidatus Falkowbacteria bacterium]
MTDFSERVYRLVATIPTGRVSTYGTLASALGGRQYARAVGMALKNNTHPFVHPGAKHCVPCHRVVCADGRLGGFNRGRAAKRKLLVAEGVVIKKGKINFDQYLFRG